MSSKKERESILKKTVKEVKKYGENGVCTCKDKRERELESKGLKEKVLEFKEVFRKRAKSFCAKRIWQSDIILQNRFAVKFISFVSLLSDIFIKYIYIYFNCYMYNYL